jgi:hypothetical protein
VVAQFNASQFNYFRRPLRAATAWRSKETGSTFRWGWTIDSIIFTLKGNVNTDAIQFHKLIVYSRIVLMK